jgi:hypothetical protein
MISSDVLSIIAGYIDLEHYYVLISIKPKIFTIEKYNNCQREYELFFYKTIKRKWQLCCAQIDKLPKNIRAKYLYFQCQYDTITEIISALEYCNLFVYTGIEDFKYILSNSNRTEVIKKCTLSGYLIRSFDNVYNNKEVEIKYVYDPIYGIPSLISMPKICIICPGFKSQTYSDLNGLWKLYLEVMYKFDEILEGSYNNIIHIGNNIINGNISGIFNSIIETVTPTTLDGIEAQYDEILELVNYKMENL